MENLCDFTINFDTLKMGHNKSEMWVEVKNAYIEPNDISELIKTFPTNVILEELKSRFANFDIIFKTISDEL